MVDQITNLIIVLNVILLFVLVVGIRWWQKRHGRVTEKKLAIILAGYFSYSFITTSIPLLIIYPRVMIIVDTVWLLIMWGIGYPYFRWIYRKFTSINVNKT
jgi:hypothetical protein